ncbi:unnamed protein product [Linum trigynum]|uniref:Trichohyalin n=1 Tax=Linum trigynum TaxID=586398 RepID=A0AAV2DW26_9ROSI
MASDSALHEADRAVDGALGYPKSYAKCCRDGGVGIFNQGPPLTFTPYYPIHHHQIERARDLEQMFPVVDPKAKATAKPKIFVSLLWKQLNHLGNAGFDPETIRVDQYGNVLYFHADKASPLYWDIDHWFPCSRGGLTVPSNLRILQWQVCRRKHNKLEFQVPWWDLQLGISVNQFLSIFASSNSDFKKRGFSFLFLEGENEELNSSQTVDSHSFPHHFSESKHELGLAPAAIVVTRRRGETQDMVLKSLDHNKQIRPYSPIVASKKGGGLKENDDPEFALNPYQAIVKARDSLKQREEAQKLEAEIRNLDGEVDELMRGNETEKLLIQDLELELTKRRRRAEKCRRLAEAQSSYRTMLEKMIRDAMHQSVVYKEQVRLNQAATSALMARLEAQKAICDASEKELHKKFRQRDELEKEIRHGWEEDQQARKRLRVDDVDDEEEQEVDDFVHSKAIGYVEDKVKEEVDDEHDRLVSELESQVLIEEKLQALEIDEEEKKQPKEEEEKVATKLPMIRGKEREDVEVEEDSERKNQRGKGNVDKWLQLLLEGSAFVEEDFEPEKAAPPPPYRRSSISTTEDIITKLNDKFPQREPKQHRHGEAGEKLIVARNENFDKGKQEKKKGLVRSESAKTLRRIPSSPSLLISSVRKGVESMLKKKKSIR